MKCIAKTLFGLEKVLADELETLGAANITIANRAVLFTGDKRLLYRVNIFSRTALSYLFVLSEFRIRSRDDLYRNSMRIRWDRYLDNRMTFSVVPVVSSPVFSHSGYAALVVKDAVADWFRNQTGKRPSVDTKDPDIVINLHISNDLVTLSLDSSVVPLYKRGYRKEQGQAPINEVLAASIIMMSGWTPDLPLVDPMCGSGTIPVEAALIATGTPPGNFRNFYGFQRWKDYDELLYNKIKVEAVAQIQNKSVRIFASDISEEAVNWTRLNAESAGTADLISLQRIDFADLKPSTDNGYIIFNPPYGQRLKHEDLAALYEMIGTSLKHNFTGFTALLITADKDSLKHIGLKHSMKTILYNGSLECLLVRYEMYAGSRKGLRHDPDSD